MAGTGTAPASESAQGPAIKGLHHAAFRCRDSGETRAFYEDFLGLPLVEAFEIRQTMTGRSTSVLHTFFEMGDGSCMAFFEAPGRPFEFKDQHDFDLHVALEVELSARKEEPEHSGGGDRIRAAREALEEWQRTKPGAASREAAGT